MSDGDRKVVIEVIGAELAEAMDALAAAVVGESCALERIAALESEVARLREALQEIAKGEGPFSRDPLTHAEGCIEHMAGLARAALAAPREESPAGCEHLDCLGECDPGCEDAGCPEREEGDR